jgi:hypothetical protein
MPEGMLSGWRRELDDGAIDRAKVTNILDRAYACVFFSLTLSHHTPLASGNSRLRVFVVEPTE